MDGRIFKYIVKSCAYIAYFFIVLLMFLLIGGRFIGDFKLRRKLPEIFLYIDAKDSIIFDLATSLFFGIIGSILFLIWSFLILITFFIVKESFKAFFVYFKDNGLSGFFGDINEKLAELLNHLNSESRAAKKVWFVWSGMAMAILGLWLSIK